MSKADYVRLLTEFQAAYSRFGRQVKYVRVLSAGSSHNRPFNPDQQELLCSVSLPWDASREKFTVFPAFVVADKRYSSEEAIAEFKRLCAEAGAALPTSFFECLSGYVPPLVPTAESWWIAVLLFLLEETQSRSDGSTESERSLPRPFLLSIEAIRDCGLDTDQPQLPEWGEPDGEGAGDSAAGADTAAEPNKPPIPVCQTETVKLFGPGEQPEVAATATSTKRSTERGEGRTKLIAALTEHHQYANGGCLNQAPIGNNELARQADVSISTASEFFKAQFGGHTSYRRMCNDSTALLTALKLLNHDFAPHQLFGSAPPDEAEREDED